MDLLEFWRNEWNAHGGGQYGQKAVARHLAALLRLTGKERLLDVGCGEGRLLQNLPAAKKAGADFSAHLVKKARKRNPRATIALADAAQLPFKSGSFDRVLTNSTVIYYSPAYADRALRELERVCKDGGWIVVGDVADADAYPLGRAGYAVRTAVLNALGKPHYTRYTRAFFESRGYRTERNPFNDRFNAVKQKREKRV